MDTRPLQAWQKVSSQPIGPPDPFLAGKFTRDRICQTVFLPAAACRPPIVGFQDGEKVGSHLRLGADCHRRCRRAAVYLTSRSKLPHEATGQGARDKNTNKAIECHWEAVSRTRCRVDQRGES